MHAKNNLKKNSGENFFLNSSLFKKIKGKIKQKRAKQSLES